MTEERTRTADAAVRPRTERRRAGDGLVIGILLVSTFVVILNETIISVALPGIMQDLRIKPATGQWLTTAFLLTTAVVIPTTGFLLERFRTRTLFFAAMTLFATGTLICALSPGFGMLVAGRVVQATGTAIMLPLLMTTVLTLVPPASRGRMMGNISIVIAVAPAIGPTIAGVVLSLAPWRGIFWIVLPIALVALVVGGIRMRDVGESRRVPLDVVSVVLSALAFSGLIYGLSSFAEEAQGATVPPEWIPLGIGGLALAAFVLRQLRLQSRDRALLDLRTFTSRTFAVTIVMFTVMVAVLFGAIIVLPIYMQDVLHFSALTTGLVLLPGGLIMGLASPVVGRVYDRRGPRVLVVPGAAAISAALWAMTMFGTDTSWGYVLGAHVLLSLGLAALFTPLFTAGLGAVAPHLYSHASATVSTVQQLAGSAGTALFIVVLTARSVALSPGGTPGDAAEAGGVQGAFLTGAVISLLALVAAFFVRRPPEDAEAAPMH